MREDWMEIEFGKLCTFSQGIQVPVPEQHENPADGLIRFLRIVDFTQGDEPPRYVKRVEGVHNVNREDISMVRYGTVGFVCTNKEGAIANNLFRIIPNYDIDKKYLIHFLKSDFFKRYLNSKGATMAALSFGLIKPISIPIPPLPEQRSIVAKIEQLFSELDNGIANLKAAKDKLEIYRQAVLKKAFEGELTKEWRIKQKKEIKLEFIGFGDLCKFTQGIQVPIPNQSEVQKKGQVRFLRIIDFTQGNEPPRFIDNPGERYLVNSSDIALVRYGTVGFVCTGKEGAIANNLFKVAPDERLINPYLIHFLNSHLFKSHLKPKGATMQALSFGLIKPIPIPVFEIDEQKQIVQEIESRLAVCDNILDNIEEGLEKSEALRQSILKQAFEGKLLSGEELEACRQEPDWEPAEKLLERVKNQKEVTA